MTEETARLLCIASLMTAGLIGAWVAWASYQARHHGSPGADAPVWAGLALLFFAFAQVKVVRDMGWLAGWGQWLRTVAKQHNAYADRRPFQILASVAVAIIVVILLVYGLYWLWHAIKRYRLAVAFASMAIGFAAIRFISLHEVDAWNVAFPWVKTIVELTASLGASAIGVARLRQLWPYARLWQRT